MLYGISHDPLLYLLFDAVRCCVKLGNDIHHAVWDVKLCNSNTIHHALWSSVMGEASHHGCQVPLVHIVAIVGRIIGCHRLMSIVMLLLKLGLLTAYLNASKFILAQMNLKKRCTKA